MKGDGTNGHTTVTNVIDYGQYDTGGNAIKIPACQYCGNYHTTTCPRIASIEYYPNGTVKRVELRG